MSRDHLDDTALMHLIAQGDEWAFGSFYDRYKSLVYGLLCQMLADTAAAEEITLDVFVQIWRHAPTYRAQTASVRTWMTAIARHKAIDRLRRMKRSFETHHPHWAEANLEKIADDSDPAADLSAQEERRRVIRAIGKLPEEQKRVLGLAYFKGYSHGKIAEALELPLGTVKTRIRTAMQHLKTLLGKE